MCAILREVIEIARRRHLEGNTVKSLFSRIGRIGFGTSYLDRYYQGVVGRGAGYPTIDEARKDYQSVLIQRHIPRSM
jgi:hypothetical protein